MMVHDHVAVLVENLDRRNGKEPALADQELQLVLLRGLVSDSRADHALVVINMFGGLSVLVAHFGDRHNDVVGLEEMRGEALLEAGRSPERYRP